MLTVGQPPFQSPQQVVVQQTARIGKRGFKSVETREQRCGLPGFHQAPGFELQQIGAASEAHALDRIATGGQQLMAVEGFRCDLQCVVDQPLMALGPGPQTEAVFSELHRSLVAVREAMGQLSAHDGSVGMEPRSVVVK